MKDVVQDSLSRILADACSPAVVRAIEGGGATEALWRTMEETGFLDALVPEEQGGAGLTLPDMLPMPDLCGRLAMPLPLFETTLLRGFLAAAGHSRPDGSMTLATGRLLPDGSISCQGVPLGKVADHVIVAVEGTMYLLEAAGAKLEPAAFILDAAMTWPVGRSRQSVKLGAPARTVQAFIYAAQLGGALAAAFERTLDYANQRQQFGKPIGKFQAIQHHLALMAEQVFSARMAVELSCRVKGLTFDAGRVAVAKARTSEAVVEVSALAHAIHGAIGFTEEYDLQLLTRRMNTWRLAAGSESYWFGELGSLLAEDTGSRSLDFLRALNPA